MSKSLKEILIENNVPFKNDKIDIPDWVTNIKIDIGLSFDAPHSQKWIDNNENLIVFGFEPNLEWVNFLTSPEDRRDRTFKDYHTYTKQMEYSNINKKMFVVPVALSDNIEPTKMDLYIPSVSGGCGSLLMPSPTFGNVIKQYSVPVFNLSNFFELLPLDNIKFIDYIKIDVQGMDINVIKGAGKYLSEKVVYLTAEPEIDQYCGTENNSSELITKYIEEIGFERVYHPGTKDPTFLNKKFKHLQYDIYIWQNY